jgi:hypothetical protein
MAGQSLFIHPSRAFKQDFVTAGHAFLGNHACSLTLDYYGVLQMQFLGPDGDDIYPNSKQNVRVFIVKRPI